MENRGHVLRLEFMQGRQAGELRRAVGDHIQPAQGLIEERGDFRVVVHARTRQIQRQDCWLGIAAIGDRIGGVFQPTAASARQDHTGAGLGGLQCSRAAEAASRAGDEPDGCVDGFGHGVRACRAESRGRAGWRCGGLQAIGHSGGHLRVRSPSPLPRSACRHAGLLQHL